MFESIIEEKLKSLHVTRNEFSELLIRLLDYGVISRAESQVEATLYDRYLTCAELVESYLSVISVRIQHDKQFAFLRVYPPGAEVPGLADENDQPFNSGFRARVTQSEVAVILVLRAEYEKSLREGKIDEKGCALISLEGLAIALSNLLKRSLPESLGERKTIFRRLRQLRLVQFNSEDELEGEEGWLQIMPSITSFVSEEVLSSLSESCDDGTEAADVEAGEDFNDPAEQEVENDSDQVAGKVSRPKNQKNKSIPSTLFAGDDR